MVQPRVSNSPNGPTDGVRITYEMDGSGEVDMLNVSSFSSNFERLVLDETPPSPEMLRKAPTPKIRVDT